MVNNISQFYKKSILLLFVDETFIRKFHKIKFFCHFYETENNFL